MAYLGQTATALQLQTVLEARRNGGVQVGSIKRGVNKNAEVKVAKTKTTLLTFYNSCAAVVTELRSWDKASQNCCLLLCRYQCMWGKGWDVCRNVG